MDARQETDTNDSGIPLETVEFELALNSQDIVEEGFEAAVRSVVDRTDATFLFHMPAHSVEGCQRVAAVSLGSGDERSTLLVLLHDDGRTFRLEAADESDNPFAGMALSYSGLLAHLESLPRAVAA